ncbi:mandelate racemase/muconate lactonizing enzyme family protein [Microbacterium sp. H1-D42]|uniref:mandelate racemase/muconate lactonizing enzyme family protein n=1 Tax=Microbacterium sp. H1-D42 TaxID=2925844 RepID=UPI001F5360FA|nr:mandelate racemase/muconate lactonizing enzyme family protein [Microbacterium sp. H1-D42]UNK70468.1 mandelate racemase/muconate lactonizing enzyme family protein [Microbacterium sp. H1-D42]
MNLTTFGQTGKTGMNSSRVEPYRRHQLTPITHSERASMRITRIETLRPAVQSNLLFVLVTADDGTVGLGESFFGAAAVEAYIHETAGPILLAMPDANPEAASAAMRPYLGFQGGSIETRGNAALELALWDALGKRSGLSLNRLLGGPVRTELRTYNTCAGADYVRTTTQQSSSNWGLRGEQAGELDDLDAFLNRPGRLAQSLLSEGITAMKVWPFDRAAERTHGTDISSAELDAGLNVLADIRDAVGDRMDVMLELHGLWHRAPVTRILKEAQQFNLFWAEDPIRPDSIDALRRLRDDISVPIATGETAGGRRGFMPLLEAGVIDYATVDVQWSGGISEARKVAALADAYGVPIAPHDCTGPATLAACAHLTASQPNGLIQETVRAFLRTWYSDLVIGLPGMSGSTMAVSDEPGHGISIRPELLGTSAFTRRVSAS